MKNSNFSITWGNPNPSIVIPAQAGIQKVASLRASGAAFKCFAAASLSRGNAYTWIPACAGMTMLGLGLPQVIEKLITKIGNQ